MSDDGVSRARGLVGQQVRESHPPSASVPTRMNSRRGIGPGHNRELIVQPFSQLQASSTRPKPGPVTLIVNISTRTADGVSIPNRDRESNRWPRVEACPGGSRCRRAPRGRVPGLGGDSSHGGFPGVMARVSRIEHRFQTPVSAGFSRPEPWNDRSGTSPRHSATGRRMGVGTVFVLATVTLGEEFRGNNLPSPTRAA
ncbi:MAG: hypothetical protein CM1200mP2_17120 [Planctomycetaceae bacterium]|nr:MAG: hypothetical protein CM1200mP2_17120 [Planctomycetaceae bacterium]